jgi:uncharacterized protein YuzE
MSQDESVSRYGVRIRLTDERWQHIIDEHGELADLRDDYLELVPALLRTPHRELWSNYDADADVLYLNFKKPSSATDSELTDDDVIVRYRGDEVIGLTVLHASKR